MGRPDAAAGTPRVTGRGPAAGPFTRTRAARAFLLVAAALAIPAQVAAPPARAETLHLKDADFLATRGEASGDFRRWMRSAPLSELMFLLRHGAALGANERLLVAEALGRVDEGRPDLRRHLRLRTAAADPGRARRMLGEVGRDPGPLLRRARASVFHLAVLLPAEGPYAGFASSVRAGIDAGLAFANARADVTLRARHWNTGDDDPARTAAVLDSASRESAVVIGELLSVPTLALAAGAGAMRLPLISPTATDEDVGRAGDTVFQIGPSAWHRGATLARAALAGGPQRAAVLVSSEVEGGSFHEGFAAAIEAGGGTVVWRDVYAAGNRDFRAAVKRLGIESAGLVFWHGDAEEGAALLREIQRQRLDVRVCGGEALAPAHQHRSTLPLLEGALYVADDWTLQPGLAAALDRLLREAGVEETTSLHVRGFLAAYLVAAAVQARALCAEEVTASLLTWVRGDRHLRERGFLDWSAEGADLPVYRLERGEPRRIEAR
jgi:ABC-type branched-subunit amino acid transport system substrate-binding protein